MQRKLREATGRMFLLTLPPFVFDVPSLLRGRGMRPSPVFWTALIAMLIEGKNILLVFLTAVRAWGRSPRHQDGGRTDRRGSAAHCPPLRHWPPFLSPPSYPLRTPPPFSSHEWYMDRHAANELCDSQILIACRCMGIGSMSKGRAPRWRPKVVPRCSARSGLRRLAPE